MNNTVLCCCTLQEEPPFVFSSEEEKRRFSLNTVKLSTSPKAERWTSQPCFPVLNWFYECEHRFVNKPMVVARPIVPSARAWVRDCVLATCRACPIKIVLDSNRSFLEGPQSSKYECKALLAERCCSRYLYFSGRNDQRTGIHEI